MPKLDGYGSLLFVPVQRPSIRFIFHRKRREAWKFVPESMVRMMINKWNGP